MVPFSSSIWYHIPNRYGTIFYRNMVSYSFRVSHLLKMNKDKMSFQNKPFSIAKRLWLFCMLGIKPRNTRKTRKMHCQCGGVKPRSGYATVLGSGFGERYAQVCQCGFSTSHTILLAAAHGHISVLRQRAPTK